MVNLILQCSACAYQTRIQIPSLEALPIFLNDIGWHYIKNQDDGTGKLLCHHHSQLEQIKAKKSQSKTKK